ncbi:asparagine synthase (glutamine-hydrolyzing) [Ezakiella coagulans]|uniref:asparagine synthase (glutamine-hydrolyzing) n=1 Tax=Ezakiella coagulans TaxID=46507 RepID=UPI00201498A6|nr:asparagine synthase (glutamine-hydrolyzing) [Ezakiella coagulans]UQK61046.1 asparagine synthase (glutamine-hydrolyzing) [Ezakiella coagulans]
MCGFTGIISKKEYNDDSIRSMLDSIRHRGPDNLSFYENENLHLGFARLQIIDLDPRSNQPMIDEETGAVIVFNGEVYNYKELRQDLQGNGVKFKTTSDTEVILKGYLKYGKSILSKLRGMFAFVIFHKNKVFMARDHFGIKPLYYGFNDKGEFIFGSELKALISNKFFSPRLNNNSLFSYLELQHVCGEDTMIDGVKRLKNGYYLEISNIEESLYPITGEYFKFQMSNDKITNLDDAIYMIRKAVHNSVELHKNADVKVGTFLSGGIDSSYITALTKPEMSFSVGFSEEEGKFDESGLAKKLCEILGVKLNRLIIDKNEVFENLDDIIYHLDEPQANLSSIPLYFLSKLARENATVVLSGEGADEFFGGYELYREDSAIEKYLKLPKNLRKGLKGVSKILPSSGIKRRMEKGALEPKDLFVGEANISSPSEVRDILSNRYKKGTDARQFTSKFFKNVDELSGKQLVDLNSFMQYDILLKGDRMSMAHSLELRVPFLDLEVWSVARRLSSDLKVRGNITKYALREAAKEVLPEEWYKRPKKGFPVPFRDFLREDNFYNKFYEVLSSELCDDFFDRSVVLDMLKEHKDGVKRNHRRLYSYYVFLVWYDLYINRRGIC